MMKKYLKLTGLIVFFCILSLYAESKSFRVDRVDVVGNNNTSKDLILNTITIKDGSMFTRADIQESIRNLYNLGLFSNVFIKSLDSERDKIVLVVVVKEYPILDSYEISGNKKVDESDLEEQIHLIEGQVLSDMDIKNTINGVKDKYEEEGFLLAEVNAKSVPTKDSSKVVLKLDIKEGKRVKVVKIKIDGLNLMSEKKLKSRMETKENRWWRSGEFKEETFDEDLDKIVEYCKEKGFLDAKVLDYSISPYDTKERKVWAKDSTGKLIRKTCVDTLSSEEAKSNLSINIKMHEGKQYRVGKFSFEGNNLFSKEKLNAEIQLTEGKIFNQKRFEYTKWKLQSLYLEEGYIYCQFNQERTYRGGDTIDVHFSIIEGLPAYINKIIIKGNIKTQERVIRREMAIFPGDIYCQSALERSLRNIQYLNYFTDVKHEIKPVDEGLVDIVFNITEREDIGQVSAGMGYSPRDGVVGTGSLGIPNFRGAGQKLDLKLERGNVKQDYSFSFFEPWVYDTPTSFGLSLFYREQQSYNGIYYDRGGELRLGRHLKWPDDYFRVFGSYRISKEDITNSSTSDESESGKVILSSGLRSSLSLRFIRDDTDMPNFPTKGSVLDYSPEMFGGILGGSFSFIKHNLKFNWYLPTFGKFVLGFKLNAAYIDGTKISRYHILRAGGVNYDGMIRGYSEGMFGGSLNDGLSMLIYSAGLTYPVLEKQLYFSVFADAGNTYGELKTIDPADMKRSVGVGVRLFIPMLGIMGFDFAHGFDTDSNQKEKFHFQIGKAF